MPRQVRFNQTQAFGKLGEDFFYEHFHELTNANLVLNNTNTADKNRAGEDTTAYSAVLGDPDPNWLPDYVHLNGDGIIYPIISQQSGSNEVKTKNSFLWRTNDNEDRSGTIGFELWEDQSRNSYGWAAKIFHPERFENARKPITFNVLLVAYGSPFACLHFSNIDALYNRLCSCFHEDGLDSDGYSFDLYPNGEAAQNWQSENPAIDYNNWSVSLSRIEDLCVVTMIGEMPRIRPDIEAGSRKCSMETQLARYDHLVMLSDGRSICQDTKYQYKFCKDRTDSVFMNIDYNLSMIENEFWKQHPLMEIATRKSSLFRILRLILLNMLAHEYPAYPSESPVYFQISRKYIRNWAAKNEESCTFQTMNGYTKILAVAGLIKQFFIFDKNTDPIVTQLNRNKKYKNSAILYTVDKYTPELIENAEKVLVRLNDAHVLNGHITEQDFIRLFGKRIANKYYMDNRDTSQEEKDVENVIIDTMKSVVKSEGYAIPASIYRSAWGKLEMIMNTEDIDENSKARIIKAYRKMEKRLSSLAEENAGLSVRRIRKVDREKFGIPDNVQGNIITK